MELLLIVRNLPRQERFERPLWAACHSRFRGILCPFQRRKYSRRHDKERENFPSMEKRPAPFVRASTPSSDTALKFLA